MIDANVLMYLNIASLEQRKEDLAKAIANSNKDKTKKRGKADANTNDKRAD